MNKTPLTVTIIAKDEAHQIGRTIQSVDWAAEVIVVDSGSKDQTSEISKSLGAKVFSNAWQGYGQQKNFAQSKASFDWVLNLDADEVVSDELKKEIQEIFKHQKIQNHQGFFIPRKTSFVGEWILHGGWYPGKIKRLSHKAHSRWSEPEVHEDLIVEGSLGELNGEILHFSFPTVESQVLTNMKYAKLGAQTLLNQNKKVSLLYLILKPIGKWVETYWIKQGFRDGLRGFIISVNAAYSIFMKYSFALEKKKFEKK